MIEALADADAKWDASLVGKDEWLNKPLQPPGLFNSGAALACCLLSRGGTVFLV